MFSDEKEYTQALLAVCKDMGVQAYHAHTSMRLIKDRSNRKQLIPDGATTGYPDLTICGVGGIVFVELKMPKKYLSPEQKIWRDSLIAAGQLWYLWRPDNEYDAQINIIAGIAGISNAIWDSRWDIFHSGKWRNETRKSAKGG